LSADVQALLASLPRVADNPHVFPGLRGQPMHPPRLLFKAALKRAGLPVQTTLHDLRRSVGTNLATMGFSASQVALALHNTSDVAAKHYVHLAAQMQAELHERHAASLRPKASPK
jgi:integrase